MVLQCQQEKIEVKINATVIENSKLNDIVITIKQLQ